MSNKKTTANILKKLKNVDDMFADEFGKEYLKRVKEKTPVRSGTLRDGWEVKTPNNDVVVENNVPYADYVENGTEHMAGAFMAKVTASETGEIIKVVERRIKNKK